jgi:ribonuclease T1
MNRRRWLFASQWLLLAALLALAVVPAAGSYEARPRTIEWVAIGELPPQARETLARVRRGGPFRYAKDGTPFFNREGLLPRRQRGYYTEYTVPTPGARDRGARRIVAGGDPRLSDEYYYTGDHYRSFRRIRE